MNTWKLYTDFLSHAPAKKTQSYRGLTYIFYERIFSCLIIFSFTCLALFFGVFNTRLSTGFAYAACFFLFLGTDILFKSASIWVKSGAIKAAILVPGLYLVALILSFLLFYQKSRRPLWDSF